MNKPTIGGVSREDLDLVLTYGCGTDASDEAWDRLRSLLDANHSGDADEKAALAVERQEPVARCRQSPVRKYLSVELLRTHMKDGDLLYSAPPEVAALQSTIAQIQARIAELESGRGVVAAYRVIYNDGEKSQWFDGLPAALDDDDANEGVIRVVEPAFTAPPAPVAVMLPERKSDSGREWDSHHTAEVQGWNACLDATAALNGVKS